MLLSIYNVLVVDDSPIVVERITEILAELDCISHIGNANSFTEATDVLREEQFNVALLDINMPGKNGIELLAYVRENYPLMKVIMLSNQSDEYYRNLCKSLGSDKFIDKSSEFENIPATISGYYSEYLGRSN